jgi:hypothetical protein
MNTCKTCRFWKQVDVSVQYISHCRAHPPTTEGWPESRFDDWCGEHEPSVIPAQEGEDVFGKKDNPPGVWSVPPMIYTGQTMFRNDGTPTTGTGQIDLVDKGVGKLAVRGGMHFRDWRIANAQLSHLLFVRTDTGDGTVQDWEMLFKTHGQDAFTVAVKFAKDNGAQKIYFNEMLEYFGKMKS